MSAHLVLLPPGPLSSWVDSLIQRAVGRLAPWRTVERLSFTDASTTYPTYRDETIYFADYPSSIVLAMVADSDVSVICFAEPPHVAVRHIMAELGVTLIEALRRYSAASTAFPLLNSRNTLVIERTRKASAEEVASVVLRHLDLDSFSASEASGELEAVLRSDAPLFIPLDACDLSQADLALISAVTDGPYSSLTGSGLGPIIWPRELLSWGGHPGEPAPPFIDVEGPNRVLYHGPYFYLPPGQYVMETHVGFSPDLVDHTFAIELHGVDCIASAMFQPPGGGWYRARLRFNHTAATERVEVHFTSMRGTIRGRVALRTVTFLPP